MIEFIKIVYENPGWTFLFMCGIAIIVDNFHPILLVEREKKKIKELAKAEESWRRHDDAYSESKEKKEEEKK